MTTTDTGRPAAPPNAEEVRRSRKRRLRFRGTDVVGLLIATLVAAIVLYPLGSIVVRALFVHGHLTGSAFSSAFHQPGVGKSVVYSIVTVAISGTIAVVLASVFAWLNEHTDARLGRFGNLMPLIPLVVPPIASAIGWTFLLSPTTGYINVAIRGVEGWFGAHPTSGPINIFSWPGLILTYAGYLLPYAYLPISAALRNIDPALDEASSTSGASRWRTLRTVTMPAVRPAITSGVVLVLIAGLALYSIPVVIGTQQNKILLSVLIVRLLTASYPPQIGAAVVLGALVLVVIVTVSLIQVQLNRGAQHARISGRARERTPMRLGKWKWIARIAMVIYLLLESVLPLAAIVLVSLERFWTAKVKVGKLGLFNYRRIFGQDSIASSALLRSVELALLAASVGILLSMTLTLVVRRRKRAGPVVSALTSLPGSVSHIVIAIGFVVAFAGAPFHLGNTFTILFLAYITLYLPQTYFSSTTAVGQVGDELLEASLTSGAPERVGLARILFPLSLRGLTSGWALAFVLVLGDLTASVLLAGTNNNVVGYEILDLYQNGTYPEVAALSAVISLIGIVILTTVLGLTGGLRGTTRPPGASSRRSIRRGRRN